jgi:hypothetical protein
VLIVPCFLLGFAFPALWLVPSGHAVIAIYMTREERKHREIVDAIERHGPTPRLAVLALGRWLSACPSPLVGEGITDCAYIRMRGQVEGPLTHSFC